MHFTWKLIQKGGNEKKISWVGLKAESEEVRIEVSRIEIAR